MKSPKRLPRSCRNKTSVWKDKFDWYSWIQLVTVYAARISVSVIVSWSCDQLLWHGKVHGKRLEFNDIQANYDTEIIDVIIIMDRGSETLESKYINT